MAAERRCDEAYLRNGGPRNVYKTSAVRAYAVDFADGEQAGQARNLVVRVNLQREKRPPKNTESAVSAQFLSRLAKKIKSVGFVAKA